MGVCWRGSLLPMRSNQKLDYRDPEELIAEEVEIATSKGSSVVSRICICRCKMVKDRRSLG